MKETPGQRIVREGREQGLSVNDIREQLSIIYPPHTWKSYPSGIPPTYVPWDISLRPQFEELLSKNKKESLRQRYDYYYALGFIRECVNWLELLLRGVPAVYAVPDDAIPFAFSIGHWYLFDIPEILIGMDGATRDMLTMQDMCKLNNFTTEVMRNDPNAIQAGTFAKDIFPRRFQNTNFQFKQLTQDERREYLGMCNWFHINFADTWDFPVLALFVTVDPEEESKEAFVDGLYESEANVSEFKHAPVEEVPSIELPNEGLLTMAKIILTVKKVDPAQFENLTDFNITDKSVYCMAAGGTSLEVWKKIVAASPFKPQDFDDEETENPLQ